MNATNQAHGLALPLILPIGTTAPSRSPPVGTLFLLSLYAVFLIASTLDSDWTMEHLSLYPGVRSFRHFVTFGFLHFDSLHFIWSVPFLLVLGPSIEKRAGVAALIGVQVVSTIVAATGFALLASGDSSTPAAAGGSAGVAGVIGAFCVLLPGARIRCWAPAGWMQRRGAGGAPSFGVAWAVALFIALVAGFAFWERYEGFGWALAGSHGAGFLAGIVAAAILKKLEIGTAVASTHPDPAPSLQDRLAEQLGDLEPKSGAEPMTDSGGSVFVQRRSSASVESAKLIDTIEAGDAALAAEAYRDYMAENRNATLDLHDQWNLAQLLIAGDEAEDATEALKRLLIRHPYAPCSTQARAELGFLYARDEEAWEQAIAYLAQSLNPRPPEGEFSPAQVPRPLDADFRLRVLARLVSLGAAEYVEMLDREAPGEDVSLSDAFEEAKAPGFEGVKGAMVSGLFGSGEDSAASLPPDLGDSGEIESAPKVRGPEPIEKLAPVDFDAFDGDDIIREIGAADLDEDLDFEESEEEEEKEETKEEIAAETDESLAPINVGIFPQMGEGSAAVGAEIVVGGRSADEESDPDIAGSTDEPSSPVVKIDQYAKDAGHKPISINWDGKHGIGVEPPSPRMDRPAPPSPRAEAPETEQRPQKEKKSRSRSEEKKRSRRKEDREPRKEKGGETRGEEKRKRRSGKEKTLPRPKEKAPIPPSIHFAESGKSETAIWLQEYAKDRRPRYRTTHRYSIILAPARRIHTERVIELLREHLGISTEAVIHTLKRHHGILATDLRREDSIALAEEFKDRDQDVMLIEQDERLRFGPVRDVLRLKWEDEGPRFTAHDLSDRRPWRQLIGMSCGRVTDRPDGPRRAAMDLFFASPGLHLRLWRNTLDFTMPNMPEGLGEKAAFHRLGRKLGERATKAIRSRSFARWIASSNPSPRITFANLIEYDNYNLWYLMAHYGRAKMFEAKEDS